MPDSTSAVNRCPMAASRCFGASPPPGRTERTLSCVTDVAEEIPKSGVVVEHFAQFVLLEFVAREDDEPLGVKVFERVVDERFAKRACSAGDENRRVL